MKFKREKRKEDRDLVKEDNVEQSNEEVDKKNQKNEWRENFLRISADFENYKRRTSKEQGEWEKHIKADLLAPLLAVYDDFDRAISEQKKLNDEKLSTWLKGFEMIEKSFKNLLEKAGVEEIKTDIEFNPELHEAIMQINSDSHAEGEIVQTLQKGYKIKDRILRPAKVSLAK